MGLVVGVGDILGVAEGLDVKVARGVGEMLGGGVREGDGAGVVEVAGTRVGMVWGWGDRARIERNMVRIRTRMVMRAYRAM